MKITHERLIKAGFVPTYNYEWPDKSVSELMYIHGQYFVELTNFGTIPVFAKLYNQSGGRPNMSVHLRNVNSMSQIKRLYSALKD